MTSIAAPPNVAPSRTASPTAVVATDRVWHAYAVVFAAVCVMVGVYWDISWHMSIGRDSFWTPAHLLIQSGGLIAGLTSGFVALKSTFAASERDIATGVRLWGFRAPLGAWVCIWGCFAMVASAPFDNWWHDAYGLDVKIVSPPHTVLALGIYAIVNGALLLTLANQNRRAAAARRGPFALLYLVAGGMLVMNFGIFLTEYSIRFLQHGAEFYRVTAIVFPFALVAVARASTHRWAATIAAGVYMAAMLILMWVIQLLPATPMLGPIYQPITHMVGMSWPLWLVVPAIGIDLVRQRIGTRVPMPRQALALGVVFVVAFLAIQWPWASFLVESPLARNWFINADNFVYWATPAYVERSHRFAENASRGFVGALPMTILVASISAWVGLGWGSWMARVRR
jgi:hypothetical protein